MSGSQSRYIRIYRTPIIKRKKVVRLEGAFEDCNMWFYCWNCGFINNVDRNANFDGYGFEGIDFILEPDTVNEQYQDLGTQASITIAVDWISSFGTIIKLGPDGNPITTYYTPRRVNISKGCSFCGATNIFGGR